MEILLIRQVRSRVSRKILQRSLLASRTDPDRNTRTSHCLHRSTSNATNSTLQAKGASPPSCQSTSLPLVQRNGTNPTRSREDGVRRNLKASRGGIEALVAAVRRGLGCQRRLFIAEEGRASSELPQKQQEERRKRHTLSHGQERNKLGLLCYCSVPLRSGELSQREKGYTRAFSRPASLSFPHLLFTAKRAETAACL